MEQRVLEVAKAICTAQGYVWPPAYDRYSVKWEKEATSKWWIEVAEHAIDAVNSSAVNERESLLTELSNLRAAMTLLASFKGKTLMGDESYSQGAFAAFDQCADIARTSLAQDKDK